MAKFSCSYLCLFLTFLSVLYGSRISLAMSTIKAMAKDQNSCTMCSSCDNPCQPVLSPPLPSVPYYPPPPEPESTPPSGGLLPFPTPPPPVIFPFPTPPSLAGTLPFHPSPPNPILPYFPFYYYNSPPPFSSSSSSDMSNSIQFRSHKFVSFLVASVSLLLLI